MHESIFGFMCVLKYVFKKIVSTGFVAGYSRKVLESFTMFQKMARSTNDRAVYAQSFIAKQKDVKCEVVYDVRVEYHHESMIRVFSG